MSHNPITEAELVYMASECNVDYATDDDDLWQCEGCGSNVVMEEECTEIPAHGLCWQCSSEAVTRLQEQTLRLISEVQRLQDQLHDSEEEHQRTLEMLNSSDEAFEKVMDDRDRLRSELRTIKPAPPSEQP